MDWLSRFKSEHLMLYGGRHQLAVAQHLRNIVALMGIAAMGLQAVMLGRVVVQGFNGVMPSFAGTLRDNQVDAIIAYIRTLN